MSDFRWVLLVALLAPCSAVAIAQPVDPAANKNESRLAGGDAREEWTTSQMLNAHEDELPIDTVDAGGLPKVAPAPDVRRLSNSSDEETSFVIQSSGDYRSIPLRYTGKLFFHTENDKVAACSGQFIGPHVVLTAAHCVRDRDTGKWYDSFRFALQYHEGSSSKQYGYECVRSKAGWVKKKPSDPVERRWDYAMIRVKEESATGYFGWATGWRGGYGSAVKVGYPAELQNGKIVQVDQGPLFFPKDRPGIVAIRHSNPKSGKGSSGGAFVGNYSMTGGLGNNRVISVTSATFGSDPNVDIGPYFDDEFQSMFTSISRGCRQD